MTALQVQGQTAPGFEGLRAGLAEALSGPDELGAAFAAFQNERCLAHLWAGHQDRKRTSLWSSHSLAPAFSATKPIAALVMGRGLARGLFRLSTPVADLWPDYAAAGKAGTTIGHVLSHQAGLPGLRDPMPAQTWFDREAILARIAAQAPFWPPGAAHGYHPYVAGMIIGEIAERAFGESLGRILAKEICGPLEAEFFIGLSNWSQSGPAPGARSSSIVELARPKELADFGAVTDEKRAAFLQPWSTPPREDPRWRELELPAANGIGSALALARLMGAYCGGQAGEAILPDPVSAAMRAVQAQGPDRILPFDLAWGAGIMRNSLGDLGPEPESVGHWGWGGAMAMADPVRGVSCAFLVNRQSKHLIGDPRARHMVRALYSAL